MTDANQNLNLEESGSIQSEALSVTDQRALVFHILYAIDAFDYDVSLEAVVDNFSKGFGIEITKNSDVFKKALSIIDKREELDLVIQPLLSNWRFDRLGTITKLIIRMGMWEFLYSDIDAVVIINEAVELSKCFAEKDAYKFVNGVLDEYLKRQTKE